MGLRRPTTIEQMTVPLTGRMIVEADEGAPPESVRRVTLLVSDAIRAQIDASIDEIARTRGITWPLVPADVGRLPFYLRPDQYIGAISDEQGLAQCTVIVEYFDRMPGE